MYGCDLLFNAEDAATIREELRRRLGRCPCDVPGTRCPLLPADLSTILAVTSRPPEQQAG